MNSAKLNDWLQIIGMFAVVASLIFVGLEIRQSYKISLSQAYQSRATTAAEFNLAFAENTPALIGFRKAAEGSLSDLTVEEYEATRRMMFAVYYLFDNAHFQYQEGFLDDDFWARIRDNIKALLHNPIAHKVFLERVKYAGRSDFKEVILAISAEIGPVEDHEG